MLGSLANQKRRYMTSLTDCLSGGTIAIKSEKETNNLAMHVCYCPQLANAKSEEDEILDLRFFRGYALYLLK